MTQIIDLPNDTHQCIGIICNGEMQYNKEIQKRLKKCNYIIAVDGGLNHCKKLKIKPDLIVGDFDSIDKDIIIENIEFIKLDRAKDFTDLESAIQIAKKRSNFDKIIVFGGLGGRIDHTLTNIFLLLRDPQKLFLESENQLLFALNPGIDAHIIDSCYQTLSFINLNGKASVSISTDNKQIKYINLEKNIPEILSLNKSHILTLKEGEVVVCLDKRIIPFFETPKNEIHKAFLQDDSVIYLFNYLFFLSKSTQITELFTDQEIIISIKPSSKEVIIPSKAGQTISLIPFYGPAKKITTKNLKWELNPSGLDKLDKNFIGISNISMKDKFSVQVENGELLCIINNNLIDKEMLFYKLQENKPN